MDTFKLKILTPVGVILEAEEVTSVNLPSSNGEIGILPGHTRYSGLLGSGVLKFSSKVDSGREVALDCGFCAFSDNELIILADKAQIH